MATSPHVWTEMMGLTMEIVARTLLGAAVQSFETIERRLPLSASTRTSASSD